MKKIIIKITNQTQLLSCISLLEKYFEKVCWDNLISFEENKYIVLVGDCFTNIHRDEDVKSAISFQQFKTAYHKVLNSKI